MTLKSFAKPFIWIGHAFVTAEHWVPKIVKLINDSSDEAKVIEPKIVQTFQTVEDLAKFLGVEAKQLLPALKVLFADISQLSGGGMVNPANYLQIITAVNNFISQVHGLDYHKIVDYVDTLIVDYDALGADVKDALNKLAADVTG